MEFTSPIVGRDLPTMKMRKVRCIITKSRYDPAKEAAITSQMPIDLPKVTVLQKLVRFRNPTEEIAEIFTKRVTKW
jgi:hypothetical protein